MKIYMIHMYLPLLEDLMYFFVGLCSNVHTQWPVWLWTTPTPPSPPPLLRHGSAIIWKICSIWYVQLIQPISERCVMYHFQVKRSKVKATQVYYCIFATLCNASSMWNHAIMRVSHFLKWVWKNINQTFQKNIFNFPVMKAVCHLVNFKRKNCILGLIEITGVHHYLFW